MSKQLAISSAASIMAMAAFAVLASPQAGQSDNTERYKQGVNIEVSTPDPFFE